MAVRFVVILGLADSVSPAKAGEVRGIEIWFALVVERQAGLDARHVGDMDKGGLGHFPFTFRALAGQQVPPAAFGAQELAGPGDLEALGYGFARFAAGDRFWHGKSSLEYQGSSLTQ